MTEPPTGRPSLLERLALHRPELRAWALYDWANSAMVTIIVGAVYPIYFSGTMSGVLGGADVATRTHGWITAGSLATIALLSPFLGAVADYRAAKKRFLGLFLGIGVSAVAALFLVRDGQWLLAGALFALANIGAGGSFVFYDSLLPHVAREEEMDRLSTSAYALGYLGGGLLLVLCLAWINTPDRFGLPSGDGLTPEAASLPVRLSFLAVAVWWLLFSLPLFRRVREPPRRLEPDERPGQKLAAVAWQRLGETFRELRLYRQAFLMLLAFLLYNDGIGTIIKMAAVYAAEVGIPDVHVFGVFVLVQFVGIPFAVGFGVLAGRLGAKRSIFLGLLLYVVISVLGYFMRTPAHLYLLGIMVAMVQGGTQALSRSLFASMIPRHKSSEFFGFFGVAEKFAGIAGPAFFALVALLTASSRQGILSVIVFFLAGAALLWRVDVEEGRRAVRMADRTTRVVEGPAR